MHPRLLAVIGAVAIGVATARSEQSISVVASTEERDRPIALRFVPQMGPSDCGLAAVSMLIEASGIRIDVVALRQRTSVPSQGLSMADLRLIAARYGVSLRGLLVQSRDEHTVRPPWIAHIRGGIGHYVVVEDVRGQIVSVLDPAHGRLRLNVKAFRHEWSGYALESIDQKAR